MFQKILSILYLNLLRTISKVDIIFVILLVAFIVKQCFRKMVT